MIRRLLCLIGRHDLKVVCKTTGTHDQDIAVAHCQRCAARYFYGEAYRDERVAEDFPAIAVRFDNNPHVRSEIRRLYPYLPPTVLQ